MLHTLKSTVTRFIRAPRELQALVALAVSLPFDRFPVFPVGGFDLKLSSFIGLIIILLALKQTLAAPKSIMWRMRLFLPLVLWLIWLVVGIAWSRDLGAFLATFLPVSFLTALAVSIAVVWRKDFLQPMMTSLLIGAGVTVGFGAFQFIGNLLGLPAGLTLIRPEYSWQGFGFPRVHSFSLEPLYFAGYLLLPISLVVARTLGKKQLPGWRISILLVAAVSTVVLTLSRGGILGLAVTGTVIVCLLFKQLRQLISWRLIAGVGAAGLVSLVIVAGLIAVLNKQGNDTDLTYGKRGLNTFVSHLTNTRFFANNDNKQKDDSIAQRDTARSQGWELVKSNKTILLRGVGSGQYEAHAKEKYGAAYKGEPNNMVVEQLVQGGVVGLGLLAAFFGAMLTALYKQRREWLAVALTGYIVAILLQAQTFHGLAITHFWFAIGLAGTILSYSRLNSSTTTAKRPPAST